MMNQILLLLAATLACVACVHACGDVIFSQSFDKYSGGYKTWTKDMGKEDFDGLIFLKFDDHVAAGDGNLRIENPQGCVGTSDCGATFDVKLPPLDEATLSYKFMHSPGYVYGLGGKLPGLCAMDCPSGCETVTDASGFSARVMWRGSDLMSYSYYAGMTETNCGENWLWDTTTSPGGWNQLEMYVKLNTDGQEDGVQTIKYNGVEVFHRADILWAKKPGEHPIEKFTFRSFHGGGSAEWASAQDQFIYFDDIKISGGHCSTASTSTSITEATSEGPVQEEPTTTEDDADSDAEPEVQATETETLGDDSSGGGDEDEYNGFDTSIFNSLRAAQNEETFVEEGDEEPQAKQDVPVATPAVSAASSGSMSGGGGGGKGNKRSRKRECVPVPGYYCSDSNRLRKTKIRD